MPFALAPYLEPYGAYLRPAGYYATWAAYYLSYVISSGLVTILQALILLLSWVLPTLELAIEGARWDLATSRSANENWAWPGRTPGQTTEWPAWARTAFAYVDHDSLLTPSARSNPFSAAAPVGASRHASTVGGSTYRRRHSAQQVPHALPAHSAISTWRQETASALGSVHSRRSNPFSAAGYGASSIPITAPSARSASHHGSAQPYSPLHEPTHEDGPASIWSGSGGWKAA